MEERTLQLLLSNLVKKFPGLLECRYYQGDEEPCLKAEFSENGWLTCNCDGLIIKCDLPDKYFILEFEEE